MIIQNRCTYMYMYAASLCVSTLYYIPLKVLKLLGRCNITCTCSLETQFFKAFQGKYSIQYSIFTCTEHFYRSYWYITLLNLNIDTT